MTTVDPHIDTAPDTSWATAMATARVDLDAARHNRVAEGGEENFVIETSRDAARDGWLGAYPLPPVDGVDDWWCSGPQFAHTADVLPFTGWYQDDDLDDGVAL